MFRFSKYTSNDIERMTTTISSSNIKSIKDLCIDCENQIAVKLNVNSTTPLCTTVVTTESMCGFKEMHFVTKFTNIELYNSTCYESSFLDRNKNLNNAKKMDCATIKNSSNFQKEIVEDLRNVYIQLLNLSASGMSQINDLTHLIYYNYLFHYYVDKIKFMLNNWSDKILETYNLDELNTNYQAQRKRLDKMSMNRIIPIFICGGFIAIPFVIIGSYLSICWLPCYTACKIATLDDEIEQKRIAQAKDKLNYWE
jgi:hypothetical protein